MLTASGAGGINEIQYAALLLMISRATGYEAGVFTHFVANEQIYDRHIDNAHEMLRRAEEKAKNEAESNVASEGDVSSAKALSPMLVLNKEPFCKLEDITVEDFEMKDYDPMQPQLKFELGV